MLDSRRSIATPEGVELALRIAGPPQRGLAALLDMLVRTAIYIAVGFMVGLLGEIGMGIFLIVLFVVEWFYPVLFEVWFDGSTPGKRALGLRVLNDTGTPVDFQASLLRNLLRFADFLPFFYAFGLAAMFANRDFKRLGDLAAGTLVVYRYREGEPAPLPAEEPEQPLERLETDEQRTIVEYAERLSTWTDARALELATIARPLVGAEGSEARRHLVAMANWLVGRR